MRSENGNANSSRTSSSVQSVRTAPRRSTSVALRTASERVISTANLTLFRRCARLGSSMLPFSAAQGRPAGPNAGGKYSWPPGSLSTDVGNCSRHYRGGWPGAGRQLALAAPMRALSPIRPGRLWICAPAARAICRSTTTLASIAPSRCRPTIPRSALCGRCLQQSPVFDACVAPFRYAYPVDRMIQGLKYRRELVYGRILGQLLARHLSRRDTRPELVIPVPLGMARYRERGFNQARELALPVCEALGLTLNSQSGRASSRDTGAGSAGSERAAHEYTACFRVDGAADRATCRHHR